VPLQRLDLTVAPDHDPALFTRGVIVEFDSQLDGDEVAMRVHERGVGETRSCGTGAAAAALAARAWALAGGGEPVDDWRVDVPGGTVRVRVLGDRVELSGPAVLVADGTVTL
jgi:diaminopimelate epimerase